MKGKKFLSDTPSKLKSRLDPYITWPSSRLSQIISHLKSSTSTSSQIHFLLQPTITPIQQNSLCLTLLTVGMSDTFYYPDGPSTAVPDSDEPPPYSRLAEPCATTTATSGPPPYDGATATAAPGPPPASSSSGVSGGPQTPQTTIASGALQYIGGYWCLPAQTPLPPSTSQAVPPPAPAKAPTVYAPPKLIDGHWTCMPVETPEAAPPPATPKAITLEEGPQCIGGKWYLPGQIPPSS